MVASIVVLIVGSILTLLGYFIYKFKIVNIIAGYDSERVKDSDGLAKWMGKCAAGTGILAITTSSISLIVAEDKYETYFLLFFMFSSMFSGIIALAGSQKYYK